MPKTYESTSCGLDLTFSGPESVEIYDQQSGKSGACLEDAVTNVIYRSTLPKWQRAFADALKALTKVERLVDSAATAKAQSRAKDATVVEDVMEKAKKLANA